MEPITGGNFLRLDPDLVISATQPSGILVVLLITDQMIYHHQQHSQGALLRERVTILPGPRPGLMFGLVALASHHIFGENISWERPGRNQSREIKSMHLNP